MRKQIICIISMLAVLMSILCFPVSASDSLSLTVSEVTATPGSEMDVTVSVANNTGLAGLMFSVEYDSILTLTKVTFNSAFGSLLTAAEPYTNPQVLAMVSPYENSTATGVFATLTFKVSEQAQVGYKAEINLIYDEEDIFDSNWDSVSTVAYNGSVSVIEAPKGVTASGKVTSFNSETDDVTVELFAAGSATAAYTTTVKGNAATYAIEGVAAGNYTMKVSKKNHVTREYNVTVGSEAVVADAKIHLKGDVDGNGTVTTMDFMRVNSHARGVTFLTDYALKCADVVGTDGSVTTMDAMRINAHAKGTNFLW